MALLFIDSFDHYGTPEVVSKWTDGFILPAIKVGVGRCGTNCLHMSTFNGLIKGLPFGSNRCTFGFAFNIGYLTLEGSVPMGGYLGTRYNQSHVSLQWNPDGGLEVLKRGNPDVSLVRTAPGLVHWLHWYYVEWQVLIHPTAGEVILRLNNEVVGSATGVCTVGDSGGTLFPADLALVGFNCSSNQEYYIDDLYVLDSTGPAPCNDFLGDSRVEYLRPRAPGAYQQWTLAGTASTHYAAVDDAATPDEDGSYVQSVTPGQIDTNKYQPTGLPSGPIFGAQLSLYAKKSEIGPRVIAPVVNNVEGAPHIAVSSDTYQYWLSQYPLNPTTGLAWTIGEINAIEAGVKVVV